MWRQEGPECRFCITWEEVFRIIGYKLNCIIRVDTVLDLEFEKGECFELNSTWEGFGEVVAAINKMMPYLGDSWFDNIQKLGPEDEPIVVWRKEV